MSATRSGISRERLSEILHRVREVALLSEDDALVALDELCSIVRREPEEGASIWVNEDWQRERFVESMERIRATIARVRATADAPSHQLLGDAQRLVIDVGNLEEHTDPCLKAKYRDEFAQLLAEAKQATIEAQRAGYAKVIREYLSHVIYNANSAKGVAVDIDRALASLRKLGPVSDDLSLVARQGKERAARFRSQKKLDEADVAAAGGNARKAEKLRNEAAVLLAQDWAQVFPGERAPSAAQ